jgi:hypothetical protein
MQLSEWALSKLEAVKGQDRVLVRDALKLLDGSQSAVDRFARENGFALVSASTNLAFRETFERVQAESKIKKLIVVDRSSARPKGTTGFFKAPPPFYPDLLAKTPPDARVTLDLRQYLQDRTGDPDWPQEVNEPRVARLIVNHLENVIRAHQNLRAADKERFSDSDLRTILGFAALGVPEAAFKTLDSLDYWKVGLIRHELLQDLKDLAPQVTQPVMEKLSTAPPPFCWLAERDPEEVLRAFYMSVILSQHSPSWNLLLANVDAAMKPFSGISKDTLEEAAPKLINLDPQQADKDLTEVEGSLSRDTLGFLLLEQMKLQEPQGFLSVLQNERFSSLFRSLGLLLAVDNLLGNSPAIDAHKKIIGLLDSEERGKDVRFAAKRAQPAWQKLKDAYLLVRRIHDLRVSLAAVFKELAVTPADKLTIRHFFIWWNRKKLNRLEYYLSRLERLVDGSDLLPRSADTLPSAFESALLRIRQQVRQSSTQVHTQLLQLNHKFQDLVAKQYPTWVKGQSEVILTSQFLERCLKPMWDPQTGKAALFIFDGMRYDIWDEFLKPRLLERMESVKDYIGCSLLPSETHITRKAISAGTFPDEFNTDEAEDKLLKAALQRDFNLKLESKTVQPDGAGTGETVRYRIGNLDVYIFELCDKELHKIQVKKLPDGREVPSRPLSFIYEQHIQNVLDTEVMNVMKKLAPGTTVFITADHGFGPVGRDRIYFKDYDLNENDDCSYLNCRLKTAWPNVDIPEPLRKKVIAFTPAQLRMPVKQSWTKKNGQVVSKEYQAVVFPRNGASFSRPEYKYNPDAYSHGGISMQELFIPMVVLRVKPQDLGTLAVEKIVVPSEIVEGEQLVAQIYVRSNQEDLRVDMEASWANQPDAIALHGQVHYLKSGTQVLSLAFRPDGALATEAERKDGIMSRSLSVSLQFRDGRKVARRSLTKEFKVRLNLDKVVRRVPPALGSILGMTPKGLR